MSENRHEPSDAELLSALMDGELAGEQREHMWRRLQAEPALQARWARYHAARAALNSGAVRPAPGFAERVRAAREQEPAVLAPGRLAGERPAWIRPAAGVAIAATVALVAIGGLTLLRGSLPGPAGVPQAPSPVAETGPAATGSDGIRSVAVSSPAPVDGLPSERVRQRLMLYLASHSEYADTAQVPTGVPYGRLGGINAGQ